MKDSEKKGPCHVNLWTGDFPERKVRWSRSHLLRCSDWTPNQSCPSYLRRNLPFAQPLQNHRGKDSPDKLFSRQQLRESRCANAHPFSCLIPLSLEHAPLFLGCDFGICRCCWYPPLLWFPAALPCRLLPFLTDFPWFFRHFPLSFFPVTNMAVLSKTNSALPKTEEHRLNPFCCWKLPITLFEGLNSRAEKKGYSILR